MRWVGVDEAGYGPNLGPMVSSAVVAEGAEGGDAGLWARSNPAGAFWDELRGSVSRAGGPNERLWIDDSKAVFKGRKGADRLVAACLASLDAVGSPEPNTLAELLGCLSERGAEESELTRWTDPASPAPPWPRPELAQLARLRHGRRSLTPSGGAWRLTHVRSVVVGPERFNARLGRHASKAGVHFESFRKLLDLAWDLAADGRPTRVTADKHGGRHFYRDLLIQAFPATSIRCGPEGPALSEYTILAPGRSLTVRLLPKADAGDGLTALASIVSKTIREAWMDVFNAFWSRHIPRLKPTAGYPVDAARYRKAIEATASTLGIGPRLWWRER